MRQAGKPPRHFGFGVLSFFPESSVKRFCWWYQAWLRGGGEMKARACAPRHPRWQSLAGKGTAGKGPRMTDTLSLQGIY